MLVWIEANQELLVKIFGAGGAGAVVIGALVAWLLKNKKNEPPAREPTKNLTAKDHGIVIDSSGSGNVNVGPREVGADHYKIAEMALGLSDDETSTLLTLATQLVPSAPDANLLLRSVEKSELKERLIDALRKEDEREAAKILAQILKVPDR